MNDSSSREGSRLGPYLLGRRLPESDPDVGHIYEAQHVESGAPALVLVPDPSNPWTPRASWTVRSHSEVSPPFLAVEAERTPEASTQALHELTLQYIRLSGAMTCVEEREDTAAFLSRAPPLAQRPSPRRSALPMSLAVLVSVALGAVGVLLLGPRAPAPSVTTLDAGVTTSVQGEAVSWINLGASTAPAIGYPLPSEPLKGQHKPPCIEGTEVEISGGCWVTLEKRAPCPRNTAEHEGKCYMPVRDPPPEPHSVKH